MPESNVNLKISAMAALSVINQNQIQQWVSENVDVPSIEQKLRSMGMSDESIAEHLSAYKKARYAKRSSSGFIFLAAGSVLGFISCLLSLTNPVPELYYWILYGLTGIAVTIIFIGLYLIFE